MSFWLVNQGKSFKAEQQGGFIYAPKSNSKGQTLSHWSDVKKVRKGDVIFCNVKGNIKAIAIAMSNGYDSVIPDSIKGQWLENGYKADVEYHLLKKVLHFSDYKYEYMEDIDLKNNPFAINGTAKMGYLYPMEERVAKIFVDKINEEEIGKLVFMTDYELLEEFERVGEELEQFEEINRGAIKAYNEEELKLIENVKFNYEPKIGYSKEKVLREKTDPKLKATRMELAHYECEIDCDHKTFTCSSGKHQYLECHHIIPLNAQKDFPSIKLDSMFNIIALCPICHSQVHYANSEEKKKVFIEMYNTRKTEMLIHGFEEKTIIDIFNKYYLNKKHNQ